MNSTTFYLSLPCNLHQFEHYSPYVTKKKHYTYTYYTVVYDYSDSNITPVLASLHWLPVRTDFKIFLMTFQVLYDLAPDYILDPLIHYKPLQIFGQRSLHESRLKTKADRAFAVSAAWLWNDLREEIKLHESVSF